MALDVTKKTYTCPESDEVVVAMEKNIASNEKIVNDSTEFDWDK